MSKPFGVLLASHVEELAFGVYKLLKESATNTPLTYAGGTDEGNIGSSFDKIMQAVEENEADHIYAFYDLGSAKMTLEMVSEMCDKSIEIVDCAFIEGAFTASVLINGGNEKEAIDKQLTPLKIK
ncbi:dihydroxyacetone kinase phosphotransfer subunit [Natronobacillus azotifigens]|uniref:phosphoenolpyruvate--glycerone phosphotransferase n=1 Tax=Natronobacillus azotifigens TaxID=472978 RepID=A0A9J6RD67_9BACI|nr:dihydroxyacetone kinase phosphoryl donor subunit DhaM [Natronobacillus azotifigens]MCZ0703153.1 dihydroxyacetone kinase phosphoryl donor subunit DhaM [Natronobacillus azotifigens]